MEELPFSMAERNPIMDVKNLLFGLQISFVAAEGIRQLLQP